jgi:tetratricopeptide (TPR) repeat protein
MADRYTYVPLIGVFIMLVWTFFEIFDKSRGGRIAGAVVAAGLLFALAYGARAQVRFWADDMTLFQHALEVTERNHVAHYMVAREMLGRGDRREAMKHYVAALEFKPDWGGARNNVAVLLEQEGKIDDAIEQYRTIIRYTPRYGLAHNNLGVLLAGKGRYAEAMSHYETALTIDPTDMDAHRNLGLLLLWQGKREEAARHLFQVSREGR